MDSLCLTRKEFTFEYFFHSSNDENSNKTIVQSFHLPFESNVTVREYAHILMTKHNVPEYLEDDLYQKLFEFVHNKVDEIQCEKTNALLKHKTKWADKSEKLFRRYLNNYSNAVFNHNDDIVHENNFYLMYHKIIHSGILTSQLIQLEIHNTDVIRSLLKEMDEFMLNLTKEQSLKIENILLNGAYSEKEINLIMKKNSLHGEKCRNEFLEKIKCIRNDQKNEFYSWIKNTYEDMIKDSKNLSKDGWTDSPDNKPHFLTFEQEMDDQMLEESYTINLGSQLKTTHNLRLISADILKFCDNICTPQRLQTAMSLYSNSLSAVVLLVDNSSKIKSEFEKLVMGSSENHFQDLNVQLDNIKSDALKSKHVNFTKSNSVIFNVGDVYITKHSNLSETHVVFHVVTDDSIKSPDISSRHPVILGLRNIMKIAYIYDIAHISIPLLLLHQMNEDITVQWCLKRAELVLKCVKGFMIEMSSLMSINDNENKTIQFVVPKVCFILYNFRIIISFFKNYLGHFAWIVLKSIFYIPQCVSFIKYIVSHCEQYLMLYYCDFFYNLFQILYYNKNYFPIYLWKTVCVHFYIEAIFRVCC